MFEWLVEYAIKKSLIARTIIKATPLTQAYLAFMLKFPDDYEITDIKLHSPTEA